MISIIGFTAQLFFSARVLTQWIMSEKAKRVVSPAIFWVFSIAGSYLYFVYGWLRFDFAIILGQVIAYYIYIWNLNEKGLWKKLHLIFRALVILTPPVAITLIVDDAGQFNATFFENEDIPMWMVIYGCIGQVLFTLRFIYQWLYSAKRGESILPVGFWIISLIGSGLIISYGVIRHDMVIIVGQSVGFVAYLRNIILIKKSGQRN